MVFSISRGQCQVKCQQDQQCKSVTFNGPNSPNPNTCVLNYGPTITKIPLQANSGIASAPKYCSGFGGWFYCWQFGYGKNILSPESQGIITPDLFIFSYVPNIIKIQTNFKISMLIDWLSVLHLSFFTLNRIWNKLSTNWLFFFIRNRLNSCVI